MHSKRCTRDDWRAALAVITLKGASYRLRGRGIDSLSSIRTTTDDTPG